MKLHIALILCFGILFGSTCASKIHTALSHGSLDAVVEAIKAGNFERFQELIKTPDFNVNMADDKGRTAIHYAAETGNEQFVDFLIKNGANPDLLDGEEVSALHYAAINNNEKVLDLLLNERNVNQVDKKGNTPLHLAALNSNGKILETLLNHGANVSYVNKANESALHWAAVNSNEKPADLLIQKGMNLEIQNGIKLTALHVAALNSNDKIAESLLKAGANVNAVDKDGWSPLFFAIVNAKDTFRWQFVGTPEGRGYTEGKVIENLSKHWTHPVQERAGEKIAELLISNGADINHEDNDEVKPCNEAKSQAEAASMVALLKKHGAKCDE